MQAEDLIVVATVAGVVSTIIAIAAVLIGLGKFLGGVGTMRQKVQKFEDQPTPSRTRWDG
jgi:predicted ABC-type sugar transport system permease subunit